MQALQNNRFCTSRQALEFHKVTPDVQLLLVINYYLQADQLKKKIHENMSLHLNTITHYIYCLI